MDDCIHSDTYQFVKSVMLAMFAYFKEYTLNEMGSMDPMEYVSSHWLYDWQSLLSLGNQLGSRVVEYIEYSDGGNLGWHYDHDSNFTMSAMLNDAESFDGGVLRFKENLEGTEEIEVRFPSTIYS